MTKMNAETALKLTPEQTLDKMAKAYAEMEGIWDAATLDEKRDLHRLAMTKTQTSCWWAEYGAAQYIIRRANFKV